MTRKLNDLVSVGPAIVRDFELLGITTVSQLAKCDAKDLDNKLGVITGKHQDPCCEDVFNAAIAQACDPNLPVEKCRWWYWSRMRKASQQRKK